MPPGTYYLALWLDPNQSLAESNEGNNASLSWGTVRITNGFDAGTAAAQGDGTQQASLDGGEAYNGKVLPARDAAVRKVRIRAVAPGATQMEALDDVDAGPRVKTADTHPLSKLAQARQQVVFPVVEAKAMPSAN